MRTLKRKAGSQRGASITFALLLFLVCAVISGVVIVAATTAAGRMSDQDEMDERYYAVAAASKQLYDIFDGKTVTITYSITNTGPDFDNATVKFESGNVVPSTSILRAASIDVLKDFADVINPDSVSIPLEEDSKVACTINRVLKADGRLEYTVKAQKTANASSSGFYTVILTFSPNVTQSRTDALATQGTATVKWKLLSVKKNQAQLATSGS